MLGMAMGHVFLAICGTGQGGGSPPWRRGLGCLWSRGAATGLVRRDSMWGGGWGPAPRQAAGAEDMSAARATSADVAPACRKRRRGWRGRKEGKRGFLGRGWACLVTPGGSGVRECYLPLTAPERGGLAVGG